MRLVTKTIIITILSAVFLFLFPAKTSAHQPYYENGKTSIRVTDPEISSAYYGILNGKPVTFTIDSHSPFVLYTGLLVPDITGANTDFVLLVYDSGHRLIHALSDSHWKRYYEPFAGDYYLKGPEYKTSLPAGQYTLVLSNQENKGKYVVVVGEKESFPINKLPQTFNQLIKVKTNIFGKPWYTAFLNIFGIGIIVFILLFLIMIWVLIKIFKRKNKKQKRGVKK